MSAPRARPDEIENIERIISALRKVPAIELMIIKLANRYCIDGELDYNRLLDAQIEVNLAIAEARAYGEHTLIAVHTLKKMRPLTTDV